MPLGACPGALHINFGVELPRFATQIPQLDPDGLIDQDERVAAAGSR